MAVSSIALNDSEPLNLSFRHDFFSKSLTKEINDLVISDLTAVLNTVNAKNIKSEIKEDSPVTQSIYVNYVIDNVEQSKVDELTTTIASVCKNAIDDISFKNNCYIINTNDTIGADFRKGGGGGGGSGLGGPCPCADNYFCYQGVCGGNQGSNCPCSYGCSCINNSCECQ